MASGHTTPTADNTGYQQGNEQAQSLPPLSSTNLARTTVHDVSMDVVVVPLALGSDDTLKKCDRKGSYNDAVQASCIVSIWSIEDTQYYTLTFTSATQAQNSKKAQPSTRMVNRTNTGVRLDKSRSSGSSTSSSRRSNNSSNPASKVVTPTLQQPEFPPRGPPSKNKGDIANSASVFQKATQLKDAILNSITMPAYGMFLLCFRSNVCILLTPPKQCGKTRVLVYQTKRYCDLCPKTLLTFLATKEISLRSSRVGLKTSNVAFR